MISAFNLISQLVNDYYKEWLKTNDPFDHNVLRIGLRLLAYNKIKIQ